MVLPKLRVDMKIAGAWVDVTCDVRATERVVINRGRANEASRADPSTCALTLLNATGKYTPLNPLSPYYGLLGRNQPLRAGVGTPPLGAGTGGLTGTTLAAPSVTAETAGLLVCTWVAVPVGNFTVPAGFTAAAESDGLSATMRSGSKTVVAGATGTATATFSTAATAAAAMSVVVPGATSATSAGPVFGGPDGPITEVATAGQYLLAVQAWSADPDDRMPAVADTDGGCEWMLIADTGPSTGPRIRTFLRRVTVTGDQNVMFYADTRASFTDNFGQVFVLTGTTDYYPRFTGEIPGWPTHIDPPRGAVTPVVATGINRRIGRRTVPLRSPLLRELLLTRSLTAYWPMEDASGATRFASAIGGAPAMGFLGTPQPAGDSGFAGSDPVPTFTAAGAQGLVPSHTATNQFSIGALIHIPATGMLDESLLLAVTTSGTARTWTIKYDADSLGFRVEVYNPAAVKVKQVAVGPWVPTLPGSRFFLYLTAAVSGANINWTLGYVAIQGDTTDESTYTDTVTASTVGAVLTVGVGTSLDLAGEPSIGHVIATSNATTLLAAGSAYQALVGWSGEQAHERILRLCQEEGIPVYIQRGADTEAMGPQTSASLPTLLGECEAADGGALFEPKGFLGLAYRTRASKYNQVSGLTLSYAAEQVAAPFEPTGDDQGLTNDVTVTRRDGSSAKATLTTGPLSVREWPNGVGLYDTTVDLNIHDDARLPEHAAWRLHLGTWDEPRYPSATVNLAKVPTLIGAVAGIDVGDLLTVTNLPTVLPPGPADLIAEGYLETIGYPNDWVLTANCSPGGPYQQIGIYDATGSRYSSDGSTLASGATPTAPTISVATPSGPLWTLNPAMWPFPITVAGEGMTVTAVAGTTSPQTLTVTRSTNGIVKTQTAGSVVELAPPAYYAL